MHSCNHHPLGPCWMDSHTEDNEMKNVTLAVGFALSFAVSVRAQSPIPMQGPVCIKPEFLESVEVLKGLRAQQEYGIRDGESIVTFRVKVTAGGGSFRDCPAGDDQLERLFFP